MYSWFLAVVPILHLYRGPVDFVSLAEVGLAGFALFGIASGGFTLGGRGRMQWLPVWFGGALLCLSSVGGIFTEGSVAGLEIANRSLRVVFWIVTVSFTSFCWLDVRSLYRSMRFVWVLAFAYLCLQLVSWVGARIVLPSVWDQGVFPPAQASYADLDALAIHYEHFFIRPASFFGEPAYYAYYSLIVLVVAIFSPWHPSGTRKWLFALVVSAGVIACTSTTGIYMMLMVWLYWLLTVGISRLRSGVRLESALLFLCVLLAGLVYGIASGSMARLLEVLGAVVGKPFEIGDTSNRLGGSYGLFAELDGVSWWFGVGLGNELVYLQMEPQFLNDVTLILLGTGVLGAVVFGAFATSLVFGLDGYRRVLAIVFVLVCFVEQHLFSSFSYLVLGYCLVGASSALPQTLVFISDPPALDSAR
ncbi:hypothetical protein ACPCG0_07350 [Propionibacteriaceae bacterium Y1923]